MAQTPELDSMRTDAQLAAITGNSPNASRDDRNASIDASTRYSFAKRQYDKDEEEKAAKAAAAAAAKTTSPRPSANILLQRNQTAPQTAPPPAPASADILTRRKK